MSAMHPATQELIEACYVGAEHPVRYKGQPDPFYRMGMLAIAGVIETADVQAQDEIGYAIEQKKAHVPFPGKYAADWFIRRGYMNMQHDPAFPHTEPDAYTDTFRHLLLDDDERTKVLTYDLQQWNVGTDVEKRALGPIIMTQLLRPEWVTERERTVSFGNYCGSSGNTLAVIAGQVSLAPVAINPKTVEGRKVPRSVASLVNNTLLGRHIAIAEENYNFDLWERRDEMWCDFLEACRFYAIERLDPRKHELYTELQKIFDGDCRLKHIAADVTELHLQPGFKAEYRRESSRQGRRYTASYEDITIERHSIDSSIASTGISQNYQEDQERIMDNIQQFAAKDGIITVNDFVKPLPVPRNDNPIAAYDFQGPPPPGTAKAEQYPYTTLTMDVRRPEEGLVPYIIWDSSRCERMTLTNRCLELMALAAPVLIAGSRAARNPQRT